MEHILQQIFHYLSIHAYSVLFISLILEFIAVPLPGETMMTFAGYIAWSGEANYFILIASAFFGTAIGMWFSFEVGRRYGQVLLGKYGSYIGITNKRLDKVARWIEKYGNVIIIASYFIPGIRHVTGYVMGILKMPARVFHAYALAGGFLWVLFFVTLGYLIGPKWEIIFKLVHKYLGWVVALVILYIIVIIIIKHLRGKKTKVDES